MKFDHCFSTPNQKNFSKIGPKLPSLIEHTYITNIHIDVNVWIIHIWTILETHSDRKFIFEDITIIFHFPYTLCIHGMHGIKKFTYLFLEF